MAGIIPAGAGLTGISKLPMWQIRDHPRGCGAHPPATINITGNSGSSPRVRGSHTLGEGRCFWLGIIPAGAGLTRPRPLISRATRDHPRGCGAHVFSSPADIGGWGSSPRVRGSRFQPSVLPALPGIIPAGAGLTNVRTLYTLPYWDHPRGCGAHLNSQLKESHTAGSSPRVRGSRHGAGHPGQEDGIIPAGAGLT